MTRCDDVIHMFVVCSAITLATFARFRPSRPVMHVLEIGFKFMTSLEIDAALSVDDCRRFVGSSFRVRGFNFFC